ncbi:MAG: L,D-transpeptidase family protein [Candidatus Thiodiazotropha sp. (ex Dulcina madagascariensis)]|nr:L,D-transpeptidase family protein [Candidatus Thiodiazotropha sp. (ex Dulcina madagascariensis)]
MVTGDRRYRYGIALYLLVTLGMTNAASIVVEAQRFVVPIESVIAEGLSLDWPRIERFYETQQSRFVWHQAGLLSDQGEKLLRWLASAGLEGLSPGDYHVDRLRGLSHQASPDATVIRELLLTDGYLRLARDLRYGHFDAAALDPLWQLPTDDFDPLNALITALRQGEFEHLLANLSPRSEAYLQLKDALAHYRGIQHRGGWRTLQVSQILRPGDHHPAVAALRARLAMETPAGGEEAAEPMYYDQALAASVRHFQRRLGLQDDGAVGPATRQALNDPVETRIAQIRANLERWRWLPHELEQQHLLVNTAGFEITLIDQDRVVFHKRTVNGRQERQTPSFGSRVTHLVVNPLWTVPRSIAVQDMLPKLQQDPDFLQRLRIRVYRRNGIRWEEVEPAAIDWTQHHQDNFPFVLKQDAGGGNSLGRIKFHMPNRYQIYLHDTPAQGLFERPNRAFSSGCVRVEAADQLARLLMRQAGFAAQAWFTKAMRTEDTRIAPLSKPMPVYLTYFTSWVDRAGEVHFRPDIYQRDSDLLLAMSERVGRMTAQY